MRGPARIALVLAALVPSCSGTDDVHGAHACALLEGGLVRCWGFNYHGQVGDGSAYDRLAPVAPAGLEGGVRAIAAGDRFTCAIRADGGVSCWGRNRWGQLGDGTTERRRVPVAAGALPAPARAISAGGRHTCAALEDGRLYCWGGNDHDQLADGTTTDRATPAEATGAPAGVLDVAAGDRHTCVLVAGGAVVCWGANRYHEVSADPSEVEPLARTVPLPGPAVAISSEASRTCAVLDGGGVSCWGGRLGDTPTSVAGLSAAIAVDVGAESACALDGAGTVTCWEEPAAAAAVPEAAGAVAVSVGFWHACAVLASGAVRCWGENYAGELGDGTHDARATPVQVLGLASGAIAVSAGEGWDGFHTGCSGSDDRE